jgi:multidrug efflux pump subunit AcrB
MVNQNIGISGRIAAFFIDSKLTPLLVVASLLLGLLAVLATPREEEPQIVVPMIDVMVPYPMAGVEEVESRVVRPLEKRMVELEGVEYVYGTAQPGMALVTVRFFVGTKVEDALVRLHAKVMASRSQMLPGLGEPIIAARSIDDVPIVTLTLWSERLGDPELRRAAAVLEQEIKQVRHVSDVSLLGGRPRELTIGLDPARLAAFGLAPMQVLGALEAANVSLPAGGFRQNGAFSLVRVGSLFKSPEALKRLVVGSHGGRPVYLRDVASIDDGVAEPDNYVLFGTGPGAPAATNLVRGEVRPAVTVAVAKLKGTNAVSVAEAVLHKVHDLHGRVIPKEIHMEVTRNYGESAAHKATELIEHLLIAMISVILLIGVALGAREAFVVGVAVPVTLAIALFLSMAYGYTLNRVTLFALIFAIGILVDDAIVVVENIHRWAGRHELSLRDRVVAAVDEVGNPTILATITVVATLMPMAFVSGLMGPYMAPIPINASVAMMFSLLVAFVVTPWFAYRFLKTDGHSADEHAGPPRGLAAGYARLLSHLIANRRAQRQFMLGVGVLLLGVGGLVAAKAVYLKMLPFDNKSEFQVLIDLPEGTPLERTAEAARALGNYLATVNEVQDFQLYVGTAAPFNFNGLVRHYYLRKGDHLADIQVNLRDKKARRAQSHDVARRLREPLQALAAPYGADIKVVEIPPGPPVLSPLVAEVYGPTPEARTQLANQVAAAFKRNPEVVDVDIMQEAPQTEHRLRFGDKARLAGLNEAQVAANVAAWVGGTTAGLLHAPQELEPVWIRLRAPEPLRSGLDKILGLRMPLPGSTGVPLGELVQPEVATLEPSRHSKNLQPVVYVVADVAGRSESPVYGMLALKDDIARLEGMPVTQYFTGQPWLTDHPAVKWDGEWQVTYEVFRDLGAAFGIGLVVIYLLIVGWFQSFRLPLVIMSPIPLTLVGIIPGHWLFGAFFTATSMIGAIALAGIIVRNSILLVEFAQAREADGVPTAEAVVEAGLVRARPIFLTAGAVMVGALVILFDPIFQGLAISLIFGTFAATGLTLLVVPLLYERLSGTR